MSTRTYVPYNEITRERPSEMAAMPIYVVKILQIVRKQWTDLHITWHWQLQPIIVC